MLPAPAVIKPPYFFEIRHDSKLHSAFLKLGHHILSGANMNRVAPLGNPLDHATLIAIDGAGLHAYAFVICCRFLGTQYCPKPAKRTTCRS